MYLPASQYFGYPAVVAVPQQANGPGIASLVLGIIGVVTCFAFYMVCLFLWWVLPWQLWEGDVSKVKDWRGPQGGALIIGTSIAGVVILLESSLAQVRPTKT